MKQNKLKIIGQFIGKIPDEFKRLPEGSIIKDLKTNNLFKKVKKKWVKVLSSVIIK